MRLLFLQPRTYDQILAALDPTYAGSRKLLQDKMGSIPGEVDAGIAQTDAKLQVANKGILDGARRRGIGFSGITAAEQAQYAATDYAPAIAKMRTEGANRAMSLQESLLGYDREQRSQAQGIFDSEQARAFQERQFQEQIRQFNEQQAAAQRAASASAGGGYDLGGGGFGGAGGGQTPPPRTRPGKPGDEQWAYNSVATMLSKRDNKGLMNDYLATAASAKRGNIGDLYKLQMYRAKRPDLFKAKYGWEKNYGF